MAEEQKLSPEEQLDKIMRIFEKIDKAQDLALISKYLQSTLIYTFSPQAEKLVRQLTEEIRKM